MEARQTTQDFIRSADDALEQAFGVRFDLWLPDQGWNRALPDSGTSASVAPPELQQMLEESIQADSVPVLKSTRVGTDVGQVCNLSGQYTILSYGATAISPTVPGESGGSWLMAIPVRRNRRVELVATGVFETSTPELLMRLARLFLREAGLREQLQSQLAEADIFAIETTQAFEELVFLRRTAEYLELSEVSQDPLALAEKVLPLLQDTIHAESLLLLGAESNRPASEKPEVGEALFCAGPQPIDTEVCRRLIRRYRKQASKRPVVKNHFPNSPDGAGFPGIRQFVLVALVASDKVMGWLLAINRKRNPLYGRDDGCTDLSHPEFGTVEAGVISSTASILAINAHNLELFRQREEVFLGAVRSLASAIDAKDPYTCGHSERVGLFARRIGKELGLGEDICGRLYLSGLLHDVGKIAIQGATLRKAGPLTEEEFAEVKNHPERGWEILYDLDKLKHVLHGVLHHHEHYDGSGYPDGLAGEAIPIAARILAAADAYDAMTSDRPYRPGMPQENVETILRKGAGTQWDPQVIEALFRAMPDIIQIRETYQPTSRRQRNSDGTNPALPAMPELSPGAACSNVAIELAQTENAS
jgi:HD-GYP domain-containing protein (c-di-GMP phosphodiesterase class II)